VGALENNWSINIFLLLAHIMSSHLVHSLPKPPVVELLPKIIGIVMIIIAIILIGSGLGVAVNNSVISGAITLTVGLCLGAAGMRIGGYWPHK
jgi:hypothetical protein